MHIHKNCQSSTRNGANIFAVFAAFSMSVIEHFPKRRDGAGTDVNDLQQLYSPKLTVHYTVPRRKSDKLYLLHRYGKSVIAINLRRPTFIFHLFHSGSFTLSQHVSAIISYFFLLLKGCTKCFKTL